MCFGLNFTTDWRGIRHLSKQYQEHVTAENLTRSPVEYSLAADTCVGVGLLPRSDPSDSESRPWIWDPAFADHFDTCCRTFARDLIDGRIFP